MSDSSHNDVVVSKQELLSLQIIVGALAFGCIFFLMIVLVIGLQAGPVADQGGLLVTYVAVAFAVVALLARQVVPAVIAAGGRRRITRGKTDNLEQPAVRHTLFAVFRTRTIVGAAIIEGVTFFMLIAYLLERSPLALILAVVLILGIASHLPTRSGVTRWIDGQLRLMEEERYLAR